MKKINFLFALALLPILVQAQKLEGLENALKSGSSGGDGNGGGGGVFGGGGRGNNNDNLWAELILNIALEPTWWLLYGFPGEAPANYRGFNEYPYADGENGSYMPADYQTMKRMSLQLTGHLQTDQDAVYGGYFQAKWSPNRAISLDVNHLQLLEVLDDSSNGTSTDHFAITNLNFAYNRVHHPKFQLWWGAGLMLLNAGEDDVLYGSPSMNLGFTWYFKQPLSLYADTQFGFPNAVFARQHQVRMQVHLKQFMLYAGYQGTRVGEVGLPSLAVGIGVWF